MDRKDERLLSQGANARNTRRWYWANHDRAKELKRAAMRRHRAKDPEVHRARGRKARERQRDALLMLYGQSCVLCGFSDRRALTLDHIKRDGMSERAALGERGVYRKAILEFRPDLYRTLCMNCQFVTRSQP